MAEAGGRLRARAAGRHVLARRAAGQPRGPAHAPPAAGAGRPPHRARQRHRPRTVRPGNGLRATDRAAARRELGATGDDDVVVGLVGRLVREKGYPEVFEAAARLRPLLPRLRVAVVGPDEPDKPDSAHGRRPPGRRAGRRAVPRCPRRRGAPLRRHGHPRARLPSRGVPPVAHGGVRHGRSGGRHRHPGLPPDGRRRRHRPARPGPGSGGSGRRHRAAGVRPRRAATTRERPPGARRWTRSTTGGASTSSWPPTSACWPGPAARCRHWWRHDRLRCAG